MAAKEFVATWLDKKYGGSPEIGDWTPEDVCEFAEAYNKHENEALQKAYNDLDIENEANLLTTGRNILDLKKELQEYRSLGAQGAEAKALREKVEELEEDAKRKEKLFDKHQKNTWKLVEQIKVLKKGLTTIVTLGSNTGKSGEQFLADTAKGTLKKTITL